MLSPNNRCFARKLRQLLYWAALGPSTLCAACEGNPSGPMCGPDELAAEDGTCTVVGVPPELCGHGFASDRGYSCKPVLPDEPCTFGEMAIPGERECHDVSPCSGFDEYPSFPTGTGVWYVNRNSNCGDLDDDCGTAEEPWPSIQQAVDHAANGDVVVVAAGEYEESVTIEGKSALQVIGRCPKLTLIRGPAGAPALQIGPYSDLTTIRNIGITGESYGVAVWGSAHVLLSHVWVFGTLYPGIILSADGTYIYNPPTGVEARTNAMIEGSLVEQAPAAGVFSWNASFELVSSVVRDTALVEPILNSSGGIYAYGVPGGPHEPLEITVRRSIIERGGEMGVASLGTSNIIDASVIRNNAGVGVFVGDWTDVPVLPDILEIRSSLITGNHLAGIISTDVELNILGTVVSGTLESIDDGASSIIGKGGNGILASTFHSGKAMPVRIDHSLIEENRAAAVSVFGCVGSIGRSRITQTYPEAVSGGLGIGVNTVAWKGLSRMAIRDCILDRNHEAGIASHNMPLLVDRTRVEFTAKSPGAILGDEPAGAGIAVSGTEVSSQALVARSVISSNVGPALYTTGGHVILSQNYMSCNGHDLHAVKNPITGFWGTFGSTAESVCGCEGEKWDCAVTRGPVGVRLDTSTWTHVPYSGSLCESCLATACADALQACEEDLGCHTYLACLKQCPAGFAGGVETGCDLECERQAGSEASRGPLLDLHQCVLVGPGSKCDACGRFGPPDDPLFLQMCPDSDDPNACSSCEKEHCCKSRANCLGDQSCSALVACTSECDQQFPPPDEMGFDICLESCFDMHPEGFSLFMQHIECLAYHCAACANSQGECSACLRQNCAEETTACALNWDCSRLRKCINRCELDDYCLEACFADATQEAVALAAMFSDCGLVMCWEECIDLP